MAKQKHKSKRTVAGVKRRWIKSQPAKASDYLHHLDEYYKQHPDIQAIIYCRVSERTQGYKHNLNTYEKLLRRELKKRNIPVVGRFREICSGCILNDDRLALVFAVEKVKNHKTKRTTVIVSASSDRFLRNEYFTTKEPDIIPTEAEFEKLIGLVDSVPLLTLLHPDMSPRKVRSYQSKWGQKAKGNQGGRPIKKTPGYKKKIRDKKLPTVIKLYKKGKTITYIAKRVNVPRSTVVDWIKKYS
ncbi:MAG: helix-turn-helix domain-containing protein [Phycisphaerae bacterium]